MIQPGTGGEHVTQSGNWRGARDKPENWRGHVMQVTHHKT